MRNVGTKQVGTRSKNICESIQTVREYKESTISFLLTRNNKNHSLKYKLPHIYTRRLKIMFLKKVGKW